MSLAQMLCTYLAWQTCLFPAQFLRLGFAGYTKIMKNMHTVSLYLAKAIGGIGEPGSYVDMEPVCMGIRTITSLELPHHPRMRHVFTPVMTPWLPFDHEIQLLLSSMLAAARRGGSFHHRER
jgi:glutamate/tyrosine decarboxylase-like PLP-dependent enzyme